MDKTKADPIHIALAEAAAVFWPKASASVLRDVTKAWSQAFELEPSVTFGLRQRHNGPCILLAAATVLAVRECMLRDDMACIRDAGLPSSDCKRKQMLAVLRGLAGALERCQEVK